MYTEHSHTCTRQTGWQAPKATTESERQRYMGRTGRGKTHSNPRTGTWEDRRLEDKRPCGKIRAQNARTDFDSQPCETRGSTARCRLPCTCAVPPRQALLSGCSWGHAEPHQRCVPLDESRRGSACGCCSRLSQGSQQPTVPAALRTAQGRDALHRGWGLSQWSSAG